MFVLANENASSQLKLHPAFDHHKAALILQGRGIDTSWWFDKANRIELRAGFGPSKAWLLLSGRTALTLMKGGTADNKILTTDKMTGAEFTTSWRFVQAQNVSAGFSHNPDDLYLCEFEDIRSVWQEQTPNPIDIDAEESDPDLQPYDYNEPLQYHNPTGTTDGEKINYFDRTVIDDDNPYLWSNVMTSVWGHLHRVNLVASPNIYGLDTSNLVALTPGSVPLSVRLSIDNTGPFEAFYKLLLDLGLELYPNPKGAEATPITNSTEFFKVLSIDDDSASPKTGTFLNESPGIQRTINLQYPLIHQDLQFDNVEDIPEKIVVHFPALRYQHNETAGTRTTEFPSSFDIHEHESSYSITLETASLPGFPSSDLTVQEGFQVHKYINHSWALFTVDDHQEPVNHTDLDNIAKEVAIRLVKALVLPGDIRTYDGIHELFPSPSYPLVVYKDGGTGEPSTTTVYGANSSFVNISDRLYNDPSFDFFFQRKNQLRAYHKEVLVKVTDVEVPAGTMGTGTIQQYEVTEVASTAMIARDDTPHEVDFFNATGSALLENEEVKCRFSYDIGEWVAESSRGSQSYNLINCDDPEDTLIVCNSFDADDIGKVAVTEDKCWLIHSVANCPCGVCIEVISIVDTCEECNACYKLTNCDTEAEIPLFYSRDKRLAAWVGVGGASPYVVRFPDYDEEDDCWLVERVSSCGTPLVAGNIVGSIIPVGFDCNQCNNCYTIEKCGYPAVTGELIVPGNFFSNLGVGGLTEADIIADPEDAIGLVFERDGECYEITDYGPCVGTPEIISFRPSAPEWHENCASCGCYELRPCPGQGDPGPSSLYVTRVLDEDANPIDLSQYIAPGIGCADAIKIEETGYCYTVHLASGSSCESLDEPAPGEFYTVLEIYTCANGWGHAPTARGCDACRCYEFELCSDPMTTICTYSDFWRFIEVDPEGDPEEGEGDPTYVFPGYVFKREEDGFCYKLTDFAVCSGSCVKFTIEAEFGKEDDACDKCNVTKVKLIPECQICESVCNGGTASLTDSNDPIYSDDEDLINAVGKYVKINGRCYIIESTEDPDSVTEIDCWSGPYETCEQCKAAPSKLRVITGFTEDVDGNITYQYTNIVGSFSICGDGSGGLIDVEDCPEE